jgi:hypothetical protein
MTPTSMNGLGVSADRDKYKEEEEIHRRALDRTEMALGAAHPDTLMSMNYLGRSAGSGQVQGSRRSALASARLEGNGEDAGGSAPRHTDEP